MSTGPAGPPAAGDEPSPGPAAQGTPGPDGGPDDAADTRVTPESAARPAPAVNPPAGEPPATEPPGEDQAGPAGADPYAGLSDRDRDRWQAFDQAAAGSAAAAELDPRLVDPGDVIEVSRRQHGRDTGITEPYTVEAVTPITGLTATHEIKVAGRRAPVYGVRGATVRVRIPAARPVPAAGRAAGLTNADLAGALRGLPLLAFADLTCDGTRPAPGQDAAAAVAASWDATGIRPAAGTRAGTVTWEQAASWIDAGMTARRLRILLEAGRALRYYESARDAMRTAGQQDAWRQGHDAVTAILRDTAAGVTGAAEQACGGPAAAIPASLPGGAAYRREDYTATAGQDLVLGELSQARARVQQFYRRPAAQPPAADAAADNGQPRQPAAARRRPGPEQDGLFEDPRQPAAASPPAASSPAAGGHPGPAAPQEPVPAAAADPLDGIPATTVTRQLIDLAAQAGLNPSPGPAADAPDAPAEISIGGPGDDGPAGVIRIGRRTGRILSADLTPAGGGEPRHCTAPGDPNKPIGNFLFAGPTGVGKTEVTRQLALQLGIELVRFDMS
ncbi:MAG: hypothetical protein ACRDRJ_52295, partial [Streptosporangiaceae bacterium]